MALNGVADITCFTTLPLMPWQSPETRHIRLLEPSAPPHCINFWFCSGCLAFSPLCRFAPWLFCCLALSPPGWLASWLVCPWLVHPLAYSPPGWFTPST